MIEHKYIASELDIFSKKWIVWQGHRIKTSYLADLIDQFFQKWISYGRDWIRLNSRIMKWQYGSGYVTMIDWCIQNDIIYLWKNYSVGLKSKCFRLTDRAKEFQIISASIDVPSKLIEKRKNFRQSGVSLDEDVINKVIKDLQSVTIDAQSALKWIDNNLNKNSIQHLSNSLSINRIHSRQIHSNFDSYGRFHSNFTTLKKEIRSQFLKINGNDIAEIDIKNSQPFFMWLLMQDSRFVDSENFGMDVLAGTVYDRMAEKLKSTRKESKVHTYRVIFGRNKSSVSDRAFMELYPRTFDWILDFKEKCGNYKSLARSLQKRESDFIFSTLIPKIMEWKDVPIITIHDSIVFESQHLEKIDEIFTGAQRMLIESSKRRNSVK